MKNRKKESAEAAYERGYIAGRLATVQFLLGHFLRDHWGMLGLGKGEKTPPMEKRPIEFRFAALESQRLEAIAALRQVCADHGDNDWPDDLHLADVIDKHLGRYLGE